MKPVKPVVWVLLGIFSVYLAVAAASAYEEGSNIFVWMGRFSEVRNALLYCVGRHIR